MLTAATQSTRQMVLATPFGEDVLLIRQFAGTEQMSRLFDYELEMVSACDSLNPAEIVGENVTWVLNQSGESARHWNGYVSRFRYAGQTDAGTTYRATVVPWLWFLSQTTDCRIFQNRTTPEIITQIFRELGFPDYQLHLKGHFEKREYCVQYRETDFNFVSRLMEEEGIFYFFEHANGKHTLVLADDISSYFRMPQYEVEMAVQNDRGDLTDQITTWEHEIRFCPGRFSQTDYNFKSPSRQLMNTLDSTIPVPLTKSFEIYDYPGGFSDRRSGVHRTRLRMEEHRARHDVVTGECLYRGFAPGGLFRIAKHRIPSEIGREYVVNSVRIEASEGGSYDVHHRSDQDERFRCRFECLPSDVVSRPARITRQPVVDGPQTAVVTGPPGEEIYPDEFGRVKVQFHWDREGRFDHHSSCWLRVSQVHAGAGWGAMDLPRVGEEVIVDFLEGNPDTPIITGRVYNGKNRPPFALPAGMTRSGMKSQTHKGAGSNEISMDDTAGAEQIRINGQYNMDTAVGNSQTLSVGVDRTSEIGNNDSLTVGNDQAEQIGNNKSVTVAGNMNVDVGSRLVMNAGNRITLKCGASRITMNSGGVINITGTMITMAAAANAAVAAPMTQVVGGVMLTTVGGVNMMNGAVCHVGAASLASVSGGKVDIVGAAKTSIKGGVITLN